MNQGVSESKAGFSEILGRPGAIRGPAAYVSFCTTVFFGLAAVIFFVLAVIGTIHNYSPVPYYDSWDDDLGFFLKLRAGDWSAWWAVHYDHRIILARFIFWIDFVCFGGRGVFSLVASYISISLVGIIFAQLWRERFKGRDLYVLFFVEAWIFSWIQKQNLIWDFQSQFILAQMLPLAGLYFSHLSASRPDKSRIYFGLAILCGGLAVGSMANGVLALPAIAFFALIAGMRLRRVVFLTALSVLEIFLYFHHSGIFSARALSGTSHGIPLTVTAILQLARHIFQFTLTYLGSPFVLLLEPSDSMAPVIRLGELLAASLIFMTAWAFYKILRQAKPATLPLVLIIFIFYIVATAAVTATGRAFMGLQFALSSRYATPALYGWAAALILFWPRIARSVDFRKFCLVFLVALIGVFMLPQQLRALAGQRDMLFQRELAALALELQIEDLYQINVVHGAPLFEPDVVLKIAAQARRQHLSVFGMPPIEDADLLLGRRFNARPAAQCSGSWDFNSMISGVPKFVRAHGWLIGSRSLKKPEMVYLVNEKNDIMGLGFVGEIRTDVAHVYGRKALYSGFEGYLWEAANGQKISVISPEQGCVLPAAVEKF